MALAIFELEELFWMFSWVFFSLCLIKNPVGMVGLVVLISLMMVWTISMYSSVWFAYVLFLVYVGGLLVLFIYICLVSSNYPMTFSMSGLMILFLLAGVLSEDNGLKDMKTDQFMGSSMWMTGEDLLASESISMFLFLTVLLLGMLLVAVRISGSGCFSASSNEKF